MSTVDPELRWWRNARTLRVVAIVLWCAVFATSLVTGWSNALYLAGGRWVEWAGAEWLVGVEGVTEPVARIAEASTLVVVWPVLIAAVVDGYARHRRGGGEAWCLPLAFGWPLLGLGLGSLAAVASGPVAWPLPALLAAVGGMVLAIHPVARRVLAARAARQDWTRAHGVVAQAVVTKVDVETIAGIDRWRVTLRYDDRAGQTRWHRSSIAFQERVAPRVGDRYEVRYDPEHPGRRASIHVDLSKTRGALR
ncbi:DUF3592 domain-containing protein [Microbacterium marinilacus]|uniref:DUF3592 domain-containing protein n=1 Tax=Microbacterium marinilacus TaxID=415209 RepID=UPI001C8F08C4|nr:DUF3592 domain-containing protein [Microbacterium marinilacus]